MSSWVKNPSNEKWNGQANCYWVSYLTPLKTECCREWLPAPSWAWHAFRYRHYIYPWVTRRSALIWAASPVLILSIVNKNMNETNSPCIHCEGLTAQPACIQAASANNSVWFRSMKYRRGSVPMKGRLAHCWWRFASCTYVYSDRWLHFLKETCLFM